MRPRTKAVLLIVCVLLCAAGVILSPNETAKEERNSHTQIVPVNNHQPNRSIWLRV
jgi:hypothetical protein